MPSSKEQCSYNSLSGHKTYDNNITLLMYGYKKYNINALKSMLLRHNYYC